MRAALIILAALIWAAALLLGGEGSALDHAVRQALLLRRGSNEAQVATLITHLGGWQVLTLLTLAAALLLRSRRLAIALVLIALFGRALVDLQKLVTARVRPPVLEHLVGVENLSFPSGHSANSIILALAFALLLRLRPAALAALLLFPLAVGLSRIMLGVHWPSDVLGGWAFGALWVVAVLGTARAAGWLESRKEPLMTENKRAEAARDNDDSELIENMEDAPAHSGASGGNLQRDIGTRAEEQHDVDGKPGVTRVQDKDKPEEGNLPRFNETN